MARKKAGEQFKRMKGTYIVTKSFAGGGWAGAEGDILVDPEVIYKPYSRKLGREEMAERGLATPVKSKR